MPARHRFGGLNWMVVSNISSGAGSVAVSARPALPKTRATSGMGLMRRVVCWSSARRLAGGNAGEGRGHIEEIAFVERRHDLAADMRRWIRRRDEDQERAQKRR